MKRTSSPEHQASLLALYHLEGENVVSNRTGRVVKGKMADTGHKQVHVRCPQLGSFYIQYHRLKFFLHHGYLPDVVDHKDTDPLNDTLSNLREATTAQNAMNAQRDGEYARGVSFRQGLKKPYRANVKINGVLTHLGYFTTEAQASSVVEATLRRIHGEFYREQYNRYD